MLRLHKKVACGHKSRAQHEVGLCGTGSENGLQALGKLKGVGRGGAPYGCGKGRCRGGGRNINYVGSGKSKFTAISD